VKEMLHSMSSMEYSQWMAFERAHGPIGDEWSNEALAQIQEQLQQLSYLLSQAKFTDKTHRKGPVPKPERFPRPYESLVKPTRDVPEQDFEEEWLPPTEDELLENRYDPADGESGEE
jgi:hypothetical protein